jgi:uncharacterized repeat protein (TIGR03803 family)
MNKFNWITKACGVFLLWAAAVTALSAQTFTSLFSFDFTDGGFPGAGLVQGIDGNFYGTTAYGGAYGAGTILKITPGGTLTTLYSFCSHGGFCPDGENPSTELVQGADGDFYGATFCGGAKDLGTVFKITPSGALTVLHSFDGPGEDGERPDGTLALGTDGDFYGTTVGDNTAGQDGTVFKITPTGTFTTLHKFDGADGAYPSGVLVQASNGDFYGTTGAGGASYNGTVFKITPSGTLTSLHSFDAPEGTDPIGGLVQGTDGDFYGTASRGGASSYCPARYGCGTVFRITPSGTLMKLYDFCSQTKCMDGSQPFAGLVLGTDGKFYGTTYAGGTDSSCNYGYGAGCGTVFNIASAGTLTTLHSFDFTDGLEPGALIQGTDGSFYGTTDGGGTNGFGFGTVFSLSVGLKPFVETEPTSGVVGAAVNILGTNLTGPTGVTFNGTSAVFTVVSKTLITTTVPAGATTGTVQVVTPNGKGLSNVPFTVLP